MITILSPAKTLDFERPSQTENSTQPPFLEEAAGLTELLRDLGKPELRTLMSLSDDLADLTFQRIQRWDRESHRNRQGSTTSLETKQALFAYKGAVYSAFAAEELDPAGIVFAQEHLRILSGLYGVLRPLDQIMPYRLEMNTALQNGRGKNLYEFWGTTIADHLAEELESESHPVLVNLASQEYFRTIHRSTFPHRVVTPVFKERRPTGLRVIGVQAKRQRGLMARYIVEHAIDRPEGLQLYAQDGYAFSPEHSNDREWIFIR